MNDEITNNPVYKRMSHI